MSEELTPKTERAILKDIGEWQNPFKNGHIPLHIVENYVKKHAASFYEFMEGIGEEIFEDSESSPLFVKEEHRTQIIANAAWTHWEDGSPNTDPGSIESLLCDVTMEGGAVLCGVRQDAHDFDIWRRHNTYWDNARACKVEVVSMVHQRVIAWKYAPDDPAPYREIGEEAATPCRD